MTVLLSRATSGQEPVFILRLETVSLTNPASTRIFQYKVPDTIMRDHLLFQYPLKYSREMAISDF